MCVLVASILILSTIMLWNLLAVCVFSILYWPISGTYLQKIAPMASTKIAFYIYYLLIISPGIHVYVYYMVFTKLLQENYLNNLV